MSPRFHLSWMCGLVAISSAFGGPMNTCVDQSTCLRFSIEPVTSSADALCAGAACEQYKACMWWEPSSNGITCTKAGTDTVSHTCPKLPGCHENQFSFSEQDPRIVDNERVSVRSGKAFKECQIGHAGTSLYFLIKDGNGCDSGRAPSGWTDFFGAGKVGPGVQLEAGSVAPLDVQCQPRPEAVKSCTGNDAGKECVWRLDLPASTNCATGNDGGSTGGEGEPTSNEDVESCDAIEAQIPEKMLVYDSGAQPSCTIDQAAQVPGLKECECTRPNGNCQFLQCNKPVPTEVLDQLKALSC